MYLRFPPAPLLRMVVVTTMLLLLTSPMFAADDGSITFEGSRVQMVVQERVRASGAAQRSAADELARINLVFNTIENYLLYLEKLGRIASATKLALEYAPEGTTRDRPADRWVVFDELLFNSLLSRVNAFLAQKPGTRRNDLVQERTALRNLRDQLPRQDDVAEISYGWKNFSDFMPAIEPDVDFAVLQENRVAALRPLDVGYSIVRLDASESAGIELATFSEPVWDLTPSPDGAWLALTANAELQVLNTINRQLAKVFPPRAKTLLDMAWSPKGNLLAGIVLNRDNGEREVFIYDAARSQILPLPLKEQGLNGNYQFACPSWSPDGSRLLFTSGNDLSLIVIPTRKIYTGIAPTPNLITEMLWSPDSLSFAFVEVLGQSRNKSEFDDRDFRGSILHRFRIIGETAPFEETSQRYLSEQTLKLISFWSQDRLLFLEGRFQQQKIHSAFWDLSSVFAARLTPPPSLSAKVATTATGITQGGLELRLEYCFVFKHLDSRFRNVYNAGLSGTNYLFTDRVANTWFLGITPPDGFARRIDTFSLRAAPYPFSERNTCFLSDMKKEISRALFDFLASYNLRRVEFGRDGNLLFFLSNSRGPLSIWGGETANVSAGIMTVSSTTSDGNVTSEDSTSDDSGSEGSVITGAAGDFVLPPPPPPPMDPGNKVMDSDNQAKPPVTQEPSSGGDTTDFILPAPPPLPGMGSPAKPEKPAKPGKGSTKAAKPTDNQETPVPNGTDFILPPPPPLPGMDSPPKSEKPAKSGKGSTRAPKDTGTNDGQSTGGTDFILPPPPSLPGFEKK